MKVIICEKQLQAADYAKALGVNRRGQGEFNGDNITITWCIGHMIEQFKPNEYDEKWSKWSLDTLPIVPDKWKYRVVESKKSQYNNLKRILTSLTPSDEVYIATDAAREGELIAVELLEFLNCKAKRKRIWNQSLDAVSIKRDFENAKSADTTHNLYLSGLSRARADLLVGMNLTVAMSVANRGLIDGTLSIGRVQTAVLYLIYVRDMHIENFVAEKHYGLNQIFSHDGESFSTRWLPKEEFISEGNIVKDRNVVASVRDIVKGKKGVVVDYDKSAKQTAQPVGYSLSALTKVVCNRYKITADEVLNICQNLYEKHKAITYPRTDSKYLPEIQHSDGSAILSNLKKIFSGDERMVRCIDNCDTSIKTKIWNDKKVSDHYAMIPNKETVINLSDLSDLESKVYKLIVDRYVSQFLEPYKYYSTRVIVECEGERFSGSGSTPISLGWKMIDKDDDEAEDSNDKFPVMSSGDNVDAEEGRIDDKLTRPLPRYNDGTLIDDMVKVGKFVTDKELKKTLNENAGIGTEATRASIINGLINREYIERQKGGIIVSTNKGRAVAEIAPDKIRNPENTAMWEQYLDSISKGEMDLDDFISKQLNFIGEIIDGARAGEYTASEAIGYRYKCKNCNGGLKRVTSKKTGKKYWAHAAPSGECKSLYEDNRGKPGDDVMANNVDQGDVTHNCDVCESRLIRRKGKYGLFWVCEKGRDCSGGIWNDVDGKPVKKENRVLEKSDHKCSECDEGYLVFRSGTKNGRKWAFWGCNNFPKCKHTEFDVDGKPTKEKPI